MKLQLALDQLTLSAAIQLIDELQDLIDIVEIGTPMIIAEGLSAVTEVRRRCPRMEILADLKIVDGGAYESRIAFEAGADIVTVLGMAHDVTIEAAVGEATRAGRSIMVDLLGIQRVAERVAGVEKLGATHVCVHTATDLHSLDRSTLSRLKRAVAAAKTVKIAVAGGIDGLTIDQVVGAGPDIVVVGGGIVNQGDRRGAAEHLKTRMQRTESD